MKNYLLLAGVAVLTAAIPALAAQDRGRDDDDRRGRQAQNQDRDDDDRGRGWQRERGERGDDRRRSRDDDDDDDDDDRRWRGGDRDGRNLTRRSDDEQRFYQRLAREQRQYQREARRDWAQADRRGRADDRDGGSGLGGLIGQIIPMAVLGGYNIPTGYQNFYPDTQDYHYRYNDGNIMRVDRGSNIISSLIPLLGGGFGVGQILPAGFGAYNVPIQYRDTYYDTDDAYYRYGDNAIYQVDPQTQMIESVVALLAGDLNIGSPLPSGYDTYNVPLGYRDRYYDTDEYRYRYADGNIYQVDAQTQIIQAIASALI